MRRVPLNQLTDDMKLARPIFHNDHFLLNTGTTHLTKYENALNNLGIFSVYVEDNISNDIDMPDFISEETFNVCRVALETTFDSLEKQGTFKMNIVNNAVNILIDEILMRNDILISLNQISTLDDSTMVHSINTTVLSLLIGKEIGLNRHDLQLLAEGAILHDIGKTKLDPATLFKTSELTISEFNHIKLHSLYGYDILKRNPMVSETSRMIALQHHERLDGTGYPSHLKHDDIGLFSKIVAVSDMFDALTAERCYRKSLSNYSAYKILINDAANNKIDSAMLSYLLNNVAIYPNGIIVNLSDGTTGIVKTQNPKLPFHPVVRVIDNTIDEGQVALYDVNLMKAIDLTIVEPD